jgi:hypothetical protein
MASEQAKRILDVFASLVGAGPTPARRRSPRLAGEFRDNWVSWREACEDVRSAYQLWGRSRSRQRGLAHEAYRAALEGEEDAARNRSIRPDRLCASEY